MEKQPVFVRLDDVYAPLEAEPDDDDQAERRPAPDLNVVEEFGAAVGIRYAFDEQLRCGDKERDRDRHRWELDPASSEDYHDRVFHSEPPLSGAHRRRHFHAM